MNCLGSRAQYQSFGFPKEPEVRHRMQRQGLLGRMLGPYLTRSQVTLVWNEVSKTYIEAVQFMKDDWIQVNYNKIYAQTDLYFSPVTDAYSVETESSTEDSQEEQDSQDEVCEDCYVEPQTFEEDVEEYVSEIHTSHGDSGLLLGGGKRKMPRSLGSLIQYTEDVISYASVSSQDSQDIDLPEAQIIAEHKGLIASHDFTEGGTRDSVAECTTFNPLVAVVITEVSPMVLATGSTRFQLSDLSRSVKDEYSPFMVPRGYTFDSLGLVACTIEFLPTTTTMGNPLVSYQIVNDDGVARHGPLPMEVFYNHWRSRFRVSSLFESFYHRPNMHSNWSETSQSSLTVYLTGDFQCFVTRSVECRRPKKRTSFPLYDLTLPKEVWRRAFSFLDSLRSLQMVSKSFYSFAVEVYTFLVQPTRDQCAAKMAHFLKYTFVPCSHQRLYGEYFHGRVYDVPSGKWVQSGNCPRCVVMVRTYSKGARLVKWPGKLTPYPRNISISPALIIARAGGQILRGDISNIEGYYCYNVCEKDSLTAFSKRKF